MLWSCTSVLYMTSIFRSPETAIRVLCVLYTQHNTWCIDTAKKAINQLAVNAINYYTFILLTKSEPELSWVYL